MSRLRISLAVLVLVAALGCAGPLRHDRSFVSRSLAERTGQGFGHERSDVSAALPPGVRLEDGLDEDEAVALALWRNPTFHAELARLGIARGDWIEAGLLRNPSFSLLFPTGAKQLEAAMSWPLDALWRRPRRLRIARLELERSATDMVQRGLDLMRDVRVAYADLLLARDRERFAQESVHSTEQVAELMEARLRSGDASGMEADLALAEAARAQAAAAALAHESSMAADRLRSLLAMPGPREELVLVAPSPPGLAPGGAEAYVATALAERPDARAAALAVAVAGERVSAERSWWVRGLALGGDANEAGAQGWEFGPGLAFELPLFDRNQGGIARAEARLREAKHRLEAQQDQIELEVREGHAQALQAQRAGEAWRSAVLPALERARSAAQKAFASGGVRLLFVLESERSLVEGRSQEAEWQAATRRAFAQLDRSVGKRMAP